MPLLLASRLETGSLWICWDCAEFTMIWEGCMATEFHDMPVLSNLRIRRGNFSVQMRRMII